MEQTNDSLKLLDMLARPAFAVKDGMIIHVNGEAAGYTFCQGMPVADLLATGAEEYAAMESGKLYLTLRFQGLSFDAGVTRMDGYDIFTVECADDLPELQAVSLAATELREPLSNMQMAMDQLLPSLDPANPTVCRQAEQMNRNLHRMLRLVGNMSDALRYADTTASHMEARDITAVIGEVFEKAATLLSQAGIALCFTNLKESVLCMVDAEKLERAIYNILSNAVKNSDPGSTVEAKLTRRGNKLQLSVRDHGVGIPDDILGSVFQRHLRIPGLESGSHGMGLGMVLIRSAATAHDGTVLIRRMPQGGTQVTMTISTRCATDGNLASSILRIDYAGGFDHGLTELSDVLPQSLYSPLTNSQ